MEREVDVVVVGGGPPGENVADRARAGGLEVVLVEHELVGGECSYWACIPSKTLLRSAAALRAAKRVAGASEAVTGSLDVAAVLKRRDYWVSDWDDHGAVGWLDSVGIQLERGHGRLDGERRVVVERDGAEPVTLIARHAVAVSPGSDPLVPPIPGLADARPWTSRDATSVKQPPRRLAIIGGGVVAAEMATAYAGFGTEVDRARPQRPAAAAWNRSQAPPSSRGCGARGIRSARCLADARRTRPTTTRWSSPSTTGRP